MVGLDPRSEANPTAAGFIWPLGSGSLHDSRPTDRPTEQRIPLLERGQLTFWVGVGAPILVPTRHSDASAEGHTHRRGFSAQKGDSRLEVAFLGGPENLGPKVGRAVKTAVARAQKNAEFLRRKARFAVKSAGRGVRLGRLFGVLERSWRLVSRQITRLKGGICASKGRRVERTFSTSGSEIRG